jgi:hypothetical protein
MNRWTILSALLVAVVTATIPADVLAQVQEEDGEKLLFAKPKKDWEWDEDKRFDFLIERLASLEASLDAVERAIAKASGKRGVKQGQARRAEANNSMMDRKGGGPMTWNEFYGTTAEKFFYHPVDPNTTYHTNTALRQMGNTQDDKVRDGVPATQSVPVHQRPPQFDYIYRANRDAQAKAEKEAVALAGQIEQLTRRRAQLEDEQAELWCLLAFRAIQRQNIPKRPMLRFALFPPGATPSDTQRLEALSAATAFLSTALLVIEKAESNQAAALTGVKQVIGPARAQFDDALINLTELEDDAASKKRKLGQFVALAQLLDDTASNLSESYVAAMDGERFKDEARKDRFRGLLQRSLVEYAQIILALDELTNSMRKEWKVTVDTKTPIASASRNWPETSLTSTVVTQPNPPPTVGRGQGVEDGTVSLFGKASLAGWSGPGANGRPNWAVQDGVLTCLGEGGGLTSDQSFGDFEMHVEFDLPQAANSGIYLRNAYEIQLLDSGYRDAKGNPAPPAGRTGAVYGQIPVTQDAYARGAWNYMDVRLVGKTITVRLNGTTVIDNAVLKDPTPGAPANANPNFGPLHIQSHVNIKGARFRNFTVTPIGK